MSLRTKLILPLAVILSIFCSGLVAQTVLADTPAASVSTTACPKSNFFFIPPWYEYLDLHSDAGGCTPTFNFPDDILPVGLAIVDMLVRLAGFVAIVSIIIAGVTYVTAGGVVDKTATAKRRIYNSLAGLAIVSVAAGVVAFIGNKLG